MRLPAPIDWRVAILLLVVAGHVVLQSQDGGGELRRSEDVEPLHEAQSAFYNGRYEDAAALALAVRADRPDDLATYELRTSALLFQLKRTLAAAGRDKRAALEACAACQSWMDAFTADTTQGQKLARARREADPSDEAAIFYLAKLDLNFIWLHLEVLGHRKGWNEYWEGRRSLDALLKKNPGHTRARVARAWIDYIVDTRMARGTRWVLGGGSRARAIRVMREAAEADAPYFDRVEAAFALWELEVRERNFPEAIVIARKLATEFPGNRDVATFLTAHGETP